MLKIEFFRVSLRELCGLEAGCPGMNAGVKREAVPPYTADHCVDVNHLVCMNKEERKSSKIVNGESVRIKLSWPENKSSRRC